MSVAASPEVYFKHESFDVEKSAGYQLVLSLADHAVTTLVATRTQEVMFLQRLLNRKCLSLENVVQEVFELNPFVHREYQFKQVLLHSDRWILLPDKAFSVGAEPDLLAFEHTVNEDEDDFIMDAIAPLSVRTLFATSRHILNLFRLPWPQVQFRHANSQIIRQTNRLQNKTAAKTFALLEVSDFEATYVIFRDGQLQYCNRFRFGAGRDLMKAVLIVNASLSLKPNDHKLALVGTGLLFAEAQAAFNEYPGGLADVSPFFGATGIPDAHLGNMQAFSHLLIPFG